MNKYILLKPLKFVVLILLSSLFIISIVYAQQAPKLYKDGFVFQFDPVPTMPDGKTAMDIPIKRCPTTMDVGLTDRFGCPMMKNFYHEIAEKSSRAQQP